MSRGIITVENKPDFQITNDTHTCSPLRAGYAYGVSRVSIQEKWTCHNYSMYNDNDQTKEFSFV